MKKTLILLLFFSIVGCVDQKEKTEVEEITENTDRKIYDNISIEEKVDLVVQA